LPKEIDPKGKGMVVNDKEKESFLNDPRDDKPTDSGSSHKKTNGKKKRCIKKIIYYDSDASSSSPHDDDDDSSSKKKPVNQFHLVNLHTLMEKTTLFGVTKCVVTYFLSILVFGRLLKTECILIVLTIPFS
jgi:hypothetical protein